MFSTRNDGKPFTVCERIYRRLLALYPKRFRQEYGESMAQLFRDQHNEACRVTESAGRLRFWLHLLADVGLTVCSEHFTEFKHFMSEFIMKRFWAKPDTIFTKVFAATFLLLVGVLAIELVFRQPKVYSSTARVALLQPERSPAMFDPFFIQTEFERIKSRTVLEKVIEEMNLTTRLPYQIGSVTPLKAEEAYEKLKAMMDLRQTRNTSLLEVRVFDGDGAVAAEIANKIVDVYRRQIEVARLPTKVEVVDPAAPGLRPVRPNVGLILVLGGVFSVLIAAIAALFIRYMISSKGSGRAAL